MRNECYSRESGNPDFDFKPGFPIKSFGNDEKWFGVF